MRALRFGIPLVVLLVLTACSGDNTGASSTAGGTFDPNSVTGSVVLTGWQGTRDEATALNATLDGFRAKYPNIKVDYQPIATDYANAMAAKLNARKPPDLFYVDSSLAPDWIRQGLLYPLDDWIRSRSFDTGQFYTGYLDAFKGQDGKTYGFPKDGNALGMAYNPDMLSAAGISRPPTNWEELVVDAKRLTSGDTHAFCLSGTLDRELAFIYQKGGALLSDDKKSAAIDSDASKEAIKWYLDLFKNGYGVRPKDLGDNWCGTSLGKDKVAIIFEGGWLDPFMKSTYPKVKYAWAPLPKGKQEANLGFTVSYSIGKDSANKDAAWVLLTYLTGPEGMKVWTQGGVANPSRKDVPAPAGKEILVKGGENAHPWSFIPGFSKINHAFNNAMTAAIEAKSDDPTKIVNDTKTAIDQALSS